jgi:hypothetical protein
MSYTLGTRVASTRELQLINQHTHDHQLTRELSADVLGHLDPDAWHVVTIRQPFGTRHRSSDYPYHRCAVSVKVITDDERDVLETVVLDVEHHDWVRLLTLETFRELGGE